MINNSENGLKSVSEARIIYVAIVIRQNVVIAEEVIVAFVVTFDRENDCLLNGFVVASLKT